MQIWGGRGFPNIRVYKIQEKKKFYSKILSQEETYCNRKKYTDTGRNFFHRKKLYYHRITFDVTRKKIVELGSITSQIMNFLLQEKMYYHRKKFAVTGRNLLSQEEI